jgi:hypothetical protein
MSASTTTTLPPLGFISVDTHVHLPPGDPFNLKTCPLPPPNATSFRLEINDIVTSDSHSEEFLSNFVEAGKKLGGQGWWV